MAVKVIKNLVSAGKYGIKCPYVMKPTRIVVHNTSNDASARNEIAYMISNNKECSFHFAVDDKEVIQGLPLDRNGWHAGDGNGPGNMLGIGIEICYSKSGGSRFTAAEKLAAKFIAQLLKERGWGMNRVTKHQDYSGKYCPHRTLDMGWQRFLNMVSAELATLNGQKTAVKTSTVKTSAAKTAAAPKADALPVITYRAKTRKYGWLPEVQGASDYAGYGDDPIIGLAIKVSEGKLSYRVHEKGRGWLPRVTGYNIKDAVNGFAGDDHEIDAVEIVYTAPSGKKFKVKYRVAPVGGGYFSYQIGNEKTNGQDGYAGLFGRAVAKIQIMMVKG